jgi:hypothetical protein
MIKYYERNQLGTDQWNAAVRASKDFKHYYLSYYLDHAAENWSAIVYGDHEWVWPLPFKSALVKWVYQPLLCQQLGPIGRALTPAEWKSAEALISKHFSWFNIKFNDVYAEVPFPNQASHRNIVLDLSSTYEQISAGYNRNVRSNLRKFDRSDASIERRTGYDEWAVSAFRLSKGMDIPELDEAFYQQVEKIYKAFEERGEAFTYTAHLDDEKVAQLMLLEVNNRSLLFFTFAGDSARTIGAMHALINQAIQERAGQQGHVLDFEGSDNDNLAYFYQSFGGNEHVYLQAGTKSILHSIKDRLIK